MNNTNSNNLGKPYLKLDFESNQELFEFAKSYNIPVIFDEKTLTYKQSNIKGIKEKEFVLNSKIEKIKKQIKNEIEGLIQAEKIFEETQQIYLNYDVYNKESEKEKNKYFQLLDQQLFYLNVSLDNIIKNLKLSKKDFITKDLALDLVYLYKTKRIKYIEVLDIIFDNKSNLEQIKKLFVQNLGATEILEQNKLYTGKSNFYPTYKILNNYSHLIAPAQNNMFGFNQNGNLTDTINYIKDIVQKYNWQVEKLTNHLCKNIAYPKSFGTYGAQMFNIWHWLKSNIPFRIEDDEELRTPARSYHIDRFSGIDCDDYSIFAACILTQLGYNYDFYVVAFNNNKNFGHIYVVCNGYVIDGVMKEFNKHPDNISKKMIIPMKIKLLGNIPVDVSNLDTLSQNLINQYSDLQNIANTCNDANIRNKANRELRKTSTMLMLKGIDEQIDWINAMPLISDINENLEPVFISGEAQELTEDYFNELDNLRSLGSLEAVKTLRQRFDNVKQKITQNKDERKENRQDKKEDKKENKKEERKENRDERKENRQDKKDERKENRDERKDNKPNVIDRFKKAVFSTPRTAFLLLLKVNFLKIASKLYYSYLTKEDAQNIGLDSTEFQKLVNQRINMEQFFVKAGGDKEKMKSAVFNGRGKKKATKDLTAADIDTSDLEGLGADPITASTVATAVTTAIGASAPFWKRAIDLLKKVDFQKLTAGIKSGKDLIDDFQNNENTEDFSFDDDKTYNPPTEEKTIIQKYWWVSIPIGILAFLGLKKK